MSEKNVKIDDVAAWADVPDDIAAIETKLRAALADDRGDGFMMTGVLLLHSRVGLDDDEAAAIRDLATRLAAAGFDPRRHNAVDANRMLFAVGAAAGGAARLLAGGA